MTPQAGFRLKTIATYVLINGWPRKYVAAELHA